MARRGLGLRRASCEVITWGDESMGGRVCWLENVKQIQGQAKAKQGSLCEGFPLIFIHLSSSFIEEILRWPGTVGGFAALRMDGTVESRPARALNTKEDGGDEIHRRYNSIYIISYCIGLCYSVPYRYMLS